MAATIKEVDAGLWQLPDLSADEVTSPLLLPAMRASSSRDAEFPGTDRLLPRQAHDDAIPRPQANIPHPTPATSAVAGSSLGRRGARPAVRAAFDSGSLFLRPSNISFAIAEQFSSR